MKCNNCDQKMVPLNYNFYWNHNDNINNCKLVYCVNCNKVSIIDNLILELNKDEK